MIEVRDPGALTSVQTPRGRPGWRHLGVPMGGAVDAWSARLANRLVGNPDEAALLEITHSGPQLVFAEASAVALAGASFDASLDGLPLPSLTGRRVRAGGLLRIGDGEGARCYLAIAGGIVVEPLLGSAATDLRTGFGGHRGRALMTGDRLQLGVPTGLLRRAGSLPANARPIRIVAGPHPGVAGLTAASWTVAADADRAALRLTGRKLNVVRPPEVPSMGLPLGAIQVPPDGLPIVMLADRPVTGGYPVPASVIRAELGRLAILRPGDRLTFTPVSIQEARAALRQLENRLTALEDVGAPADDDPGWAGALE